MARQDGGAATGRTASPARDRAAAATGESCDCVWGGLGVVAGAGGRGGVAGCSRLSIISYYKATNGCYE